MDLTESSDEVPLHEIHLFLSSVWRNTTLVTTMALIKTFFSNKKIFTTIYRFLIKQTLSFSKHLIKKN